MTVNSSPVIAGRWGVSGPGTKSISEKSIMSYCKSYDKSIMSKYWGVIDMQQITLPECVYDDLNRFISTCYSKNLPHPLLIAQAFCLRFQEYGKKYSLSTITDNVEYIIKHCY